MKRLCALLTVFLLFALPVFAGGQKEAREVEVNWYAHAQTFDKTQQQIIEAFTRENPQIKVNLVELPENTTDKLQALLIGLQGGEGTIDVYNSDVTWTPIFATAKLAASLDKEFPASERKDFLPGTIDANIYDGHIWGIPFRTDVGVFYYRKDLLQQYGEKVPATWVELRDTASRIVNAERAKGNAMYGMAGSMQQFEGLTCNAVEWFWSNGGDVLSPEGRVVINSPKNVEALSIIKEMIDMGLYPEGVLSYGSGEVRTMMLQGKLVFMRAWPKDWALSQDPKQSVVAGKLAVAEIPRGPSGKEGISTLGGWQVFLAKDSKHKEETLKFIKYYTAEQAMKLHAINDSYLPARRSLYQEAEVLKANPFFGMIPGVLEKAKPRPKSPFYAEVSEIIQVEIQNALKGNKSVSQALADAQAALEKVGK